MEYISINKKDLSKDNFLPIVNEGGFCKPDGGLWASEFNNNLSDWIDWLNSWVDADVEDSDIRKLANVKVGDSIIFTLKNNAKIYVIDSYNDLLNIIEKYKIEYENIRINHVFINFEAMSKEYDGIKLTKTGCDITSNIFLNPNLNGWDCESILLFNLECIDTYKYHKYNIANK